MESNICKFNFNNSNDLVCSCFVFENQNVREREIEYDDYVIQLVFSGSGSMTVNGKKYLLEKGDLFFISRGDIASVEIGNMGYAYIRFRGRRSSEYIDRLDINAENCVFKGNEWLIDFWQDCLLRAVDGNLDLLSEAVLLYSLAQLKPKEKKENDVIANVIKLTGELFSNSSLSLSYVAEQVGYNEKYISSLFKKQ